MMLRLCVVLLGLHLSVAFFVAKLRIPSRSPRNYAAMTAVDSETSVVSLPSPKVPSTAWRWPPVWPFPADFIERVDNPMSPEAEVVTEECVNKVVAHQRLFLKDGQAVLELVSEPVSLLPGELRYSSKEMLVINEEMITSKEIALSYPDNSFDAVSITSGVQYFIEPKDIFREVWRVLKPEGRCFVSFLTKFPASELKPTRMWTTMNDEQKIWIVGSYFHYAADEGWSSIEGYDLFSSDTKELVFEKNNNVNAYVVQAVKSALPSVEESPASYVAQKLSACKNMEPEDRKYIALRSESMLSEVPDKKAFVEALVTRLPQIYAVLREVQEIVIPKPVKAMLASYIVADWTNSEAQVEALRKGLGLLPSAGDEFWTSVSLATKSMRPKDKIVFLSDIVPLFGTSLSNRLAELPALLTLLNEMILEKVPEALPEDIQLLSTELAATDFLRSDVPNAADRLTRYVKASDADTLKSVLSARTNGGKTQGAAKP